ncbi:MAG TPA: hypothetical protein VHQ90_02970 [Thermoanaerobaculia bacterium]|nr:hypothetical protein [Thermoanaerobaculia bacterium]
MHLLSEDDLNLKEMTPDELDLAWDLWFDLAQATNAYDPPYTHGVFVLCHASPPPVERGAGTEASATSDGPVSD